jgi:flavin reductase (DIM6/NTAB) family NADH-FMN oxidoreductase RutF
MNSIPYWGNIVTEDAGENNKLEGNLKKFYNYSFPNLTVLVTLLDEHGKSNIITLAWHSACSIKPPMYGISIDPHRYSHDPIIKTGEFVINFCDWSIVDETHYCGRHSGRKFDKFAETGLTPIPATKVKPPLIKEAYCALECKLSDYHMYGDHTWLVGEVLAISHNKSFEDDLLKTGLDPLYYLGNNTYTSFHKDRKKY